MPLFDNLPLTEQNHLITNAIKVGNVVKLYCNFTKPPKDKRLILVSIEPLIGVFIINSAINPFITRNQNLLSSQISISSTDHVFLSHDSFVACHEVLRRFEYSEVERQLRDNYSRLLGQIDRVLRDKIIQTVSKSMTLTPTEIETIVKNLNEMEFSDS